MISNLEQHRIDLSEDIALEVNKFLPYENLFIFNTGTFFKLHANDKDLYFQAIEKKNNKVFLCANFFCGANDAWFCPAKGTYAGFEFDESESLEKIEMCIKAIINFLLIKNAKFINVKLSPFSQNPIINSIIFNVLNRLNFSLHNLDLNYDMVVSSQSFKDRINRSNRKRLNKCHKASFYAKELDFKMFNQVYDLIASNRERRGYPLTMSMADLKKMLEYFPDQITLFGAFKENELIASSICIRTSKESIYVFYWGDAPRMEKFSPITILAESIYNYCQHNKISILDAGISTMESEPNYGLIKFKKSLGMSESIKLSLILNNERL